MKITEAEQKDLNDRILKMLISEEDIIDLPVNRLIALATKIGRVISGAQFEDDMAPLIGKQFALNLTAAAELEARADLAARAGKTGEAFRLNMRAFDLALESATIR